VKARRGLCAKSSNSQMMFKHRLFMNDRIFALAQRVLLFAWKEVKISSLGEKDKDINFYFL
jgi:hypothetical protein